MNGRGQRREFDLPVQHSHPLVEQFSGLGTQYLNPQRFFLFIQNHLDLADPLSLSEAAVVSRERLCPDRISYAGFPGPLLIHPDTRELRICVGTPG